MDDGAADSLGSMARCREKPLAVAIVPASTAGSIGSSSWINELNIRQPPDQLGDELGGSLGKRLAEIAPRSGVSEQTITARTLHHGRQRPGTRDGKLDRSLVSLGVLFEQIKVSAESADRQPMVPAGGVGEPPSSRLQVDGQPGKEGSRASDHLGVRSARRQLWQVGRSGHSANAILIASIMSVPGQEPMPVVRIAGSSPSEERLVTPEWPKWSHSRRLVSRCREPRPDPVQHLWWPSRARPQDLDHAPRPWPPWDAHGLEPAPGPTTPSGGWPVQVGCIALMVLTASASRGPTVMVLVVGVMVSTKRG